MENVKIICFAALVMFSSAAAANVFKCVGQDGRGISYSDVPCNGPVVTTPAATLNESNKETACVIERWAYKQMLGLVHPNPSFVERSIAEKRAALNACLSKNGLPQEQVEAPARNKTISDNTASPARSGFGAWPFVLFFIFVIAGVLLDQGKRSRPKNPRIERESGYQPRDIPGTDYGLFTTRTTKKTDYGLFTVRPTKKIDYGLFIVRPTKKVVAPTEWSLELLRELEWKRFEMLCAEYFRALGKRVETISCGADGGVDARIYANNSNNLEYAIQCKAFKKSMVGVKDVRELFGVMAHELAVKGIFMATSTYTADAKKFASEHSDKLFLVDGKKFLSMLLNLPEEKKRMLLAFVTEGDYTTPSCASCGIKMVWRSKGDFWGCSNYPRCQSTLNVAKA